jgi:elongation factor Ts
MNTPIEQLKKLRIETMAGIADCRIALDDAKGDYQKAKKLLMERGLEKASKKSDRKTSEGLIESYTHSTGKVGVLVELRSETDFVARNEEFKKLAHEIAMQVAAMDPKNVKTLLAQPNIRDASITIEKLIKQTIAKVGENITVARFIRFQLGGEE